MANNLTFHLYGPSGEPLKVTIDATEEATADHWLEQFAAWMRTGEVRDLPYRSGAARVNFSQVWAVTHNPARPSGGPRAIPADSPSINAGF